MRELNELSELSGMLVYLGGPYSHPDTSVIAERMEKILDANALLIEHGAHPVSPLMNHFSLERRNIPGDYKFWKNYCLNLLRRCDVFVIVAIDGWDLSTGVQDEIRVAEALNIPVYMVSTDGKNFYPV